MRRASLSPFTCIAIACALGCGSEATGGTPSGDAGLDAASARTCTFNADCAASDRCECALDGCTCKPGPRGSGKSGVDRCSSGLQCETGLCVEGPPEGDEPRFVCSGPCDAGCTGDLPRCSDVAGVGPICVREPKASAAGPEGTLGGATYTFAHAFFGHDLGSTGPTSTALELHAGWSGGCPPPKTDPQATIVVAGLPGALDPKVTLDAGLTATLLGFVPALPLASKATNVKVDVDAVTPCAGVEKGACAIDLGVTVVFAEGTVAGKVRATRCTSMDGP